MLRVSTCLLSSLMLLGLAPHVAQDKQLPLNKPHSQSAPAKTQDRQKHSDWVEDGDSETNPAGCSQSTLAEPTTSYEQPLGHSARLEPLDPQLWAHKLFDNKVLAKQQTDNHWYRLPEWLGGTWHTDSETTLEEVDLRFGTRNTVPFTVKHKENWIFGMQRDAQGTLWQFVMLPHLQQIARSDRSEFRLVTKASFSNTRSTDLLLKSQRVSIEVERFTNIITEAHTEEIIEQLFPISANEARVFLSIKTFDVDGTPLWMSRSVRTLRKRKGFAPVSRYEGQDLFPLFRKYLNSLDIGCLSGSQSY